LTTRLADLYINWDEMASEYRPSAFWFWNGRMDNDGILQTVEEMARVDVREFLIHPVHGMEVEYLSDEFFDQYRYALKLAKEHGMKVWVYDEFGWPSGNAGGILLRDHPEYLGSYLDFSKNDDGTTKVEIIKSDRVLDNTMGAPWTRSEAGYLNTMSVEAVRGFVNYTYERIYSECPGLFQEVIAGFFTDEPVCWMGRNNGGAGGWGMAGLPWTQELPKRFAEMFGYSIEDKYALLADSSQVQLKADYWKIATQMHIEAYHHQIGEWCRDHGVKYTGHLGEDSPLMQVRFAGSAFQALSEMDEPGIDYLGWGGVEPDQRFVDHVLVPSIAKHAGREKVYCEAFGITGHDIRLGEMLKRMQMFGIYGINDIALMGFQQTQTGIRKLMYWPSIFTDAPWWGFYPEFRDASGRSIALTSMGTQKHKYALMYPQAQLEQENVFNMELFSFNDLGCRMIKQLGQAVYDAQETFEFVFPEVLADAVVDNGQIVFPNAKYQALMAPSDVYNSPEVMAEINRLRDAGASILDGTIDEVASSIQIAGPDWTESLNLDCLPGKTAVRVYRFEYEDGELFALRNVTAEAASVTMGFSDQLSVWDPVTGDVRGVAAGEKFEMQPHGTLYMALTAELLSEVETPVSYNSIPIEAAWTVETINPNTSRPSNIRYNHPDKGWMNAWDCSVTRATAGRSPIQLPVDFRGFTDVEFECSFKCDGVPDNLGFAFELGYISELQVNGNKIELEDAVPLPLWDSSCFCADIQAFTVNGLNSVTGTLSFPQWEGVVENDAFLWHDLMPGLDTCLAGSFKLIGDTLVADGSQEAFQLPLNLGEQGWSEYYGVLELRGEVDIPAYISASIQGIVFDSISEDCIEVAIDGEKIGRKILRPYAFPIDALAAGEHTIRVTITGTSASLMGNPSAWGVIGAYWQVAES